MGPGLLTLTFAADGTGAIVDGPVTMTYFELDPFFVTGVSGFADVTTDLENLGEEGGAAIATGTLAGGTLTWDGVLDPYCQTGSVGCAGIFCGTSGAPPEDAPFTFNNDCTTMPLNDFVFSADHTTFSAAAVLLSKDADQETAIALEGAAL